VAVIVEVVASRLSWLLGLALPLRLSKQHEQGVLFPARSGEAALKDEPVADLDSAVQTYRRN
jgi:hypothetical protein